MRTTRTSGGPGPDGPDYGHNNFVHTDNFARAVDSGTNSTVDPGLNRELALVTALRQTGSRIGPDAVERHRMRQRIMTEFSTTEFPATVHDEDTSPIRSLRGSRPRRRRHAAPSQTRGRLAVAAAAALCLLMSLSGMSLLLSQGALPGDALYAFKRSAESAELGLTFGEEPKALKHLEFATARVSEIETLADQADSAADWTSGQDRFLQALNDFDLDTTAATRLLTEVAATGDTDSLGRLREWAEQQETQLQAIRGAVPLPVGTRLDSTLELLDRVVTRVTALDQRSACETITSGAHDELGLLPARGACDSATGNGTASAAPLPPRGESGGIGPSPDGGLIPPGLLAVPSDAPIPDTEEEGKLELPDNPRDVLPTTPGEPDGGPINDPSEDGSEPDVLPLPEKPGIPLLPLIPLERPHDE